MRQTFVLFAIILLSFSTKSQQGYFVSIDADGDQSFSVTVGKSTYKSSASGHLVIPNLRDSSYQFAFNFPSDSFPEQTFTITVDKKDKGYQLKKNADKAWGLFDTQAMVWLKPEKGEIQTPPIDYTVAIKSKDPFARMMSAVVNDTAVLYYTPPKPDPVVKVEEKKKDPVVATTNDKKPAPDLKKDSVSNTVVKTISKLPDTLAMKPKAVTGTDKKAIATKKRLDSLAAVAKRDSVRLAGAKKIAVADTIKISANDSIARIPIKSDSAIVTKSVKKDSSVAGGKNDSLSMVDPKHPEKPVQPSTSLYKSKITRVTEKWMKDSRELVFADSSAEQTDTIRIVIDLTATDPKPGTKDSVVTKNTPPPSYSDTVAKKIPPRPLYTPRADTTTRSSNIANPDSSAMIAEKKKKPVIINSDCKNFASDSDLDKLRIKMLSESNLDERIGIARKVFRTKCFTTKQIKALTELFVNDKTRYAFFDAAYPFVSDTENFKELVNMLTDTYYIDRFKAMVRM